MQNLMELSKIHNGGGGLNRVKHRITKIYGMLRQRYNKGLLVNKIEKEKAVKQYNLLTKLNTFPLSIFAHYPNYTSKTTPV